MIFNFQQSMSTTFHNIDLQTIYLLVITFIIIGYKDKPR